MAAKYVVAMPPNAHTLGVEWTVSLDLREMKITVRYVNASNLLSVQILPV